MVGACAGVAAAAGRVGRRPMLRLLIVWWRQRGCTISVRAVGAPNLSIPVKKVLTAEVRRRFQELVVVS